MSSGSLALLLVDSSRVTGLEMKREGSMHLVPAPAVRLMKSRVTSRPGNKVYNLEIHGLFVLSVLVLERQDLEAKAVEQCRRVSWQSSLGLCAEVLVPGVLNDRFVLLVKAREN